STSIRVATRRVLESPFYTLVYDEPYKLSDRSRGLISTAELEMMKPNAVLVNTSRAGLVDTDALIASLEAGRIRGAGLDVHDLEPLPVDHRLRSTPRTVLTPHLGYVTEDTYRI